MAWWIATWNPSQLIIRFTLQNTLRQFWSLRAVFKQNVEWNTVHTFLSVYVMKTERRSGKLEEDYKAESEQINLMLIQSIELWRKCWGTITYQQTCKFWNLLSLSWSISIFQSSHLSVLPLVSNVMEKIFDDTNMYSKKKDWTAFHFYAASLRCKKFLNKSQSMGKW